MDTETTRRNVTIGLGCALGAAVVAFAVVLGVECDKRKTVYGGDNGAPKPPPKPVSCGTAPSVDPMTGLVTNYTHTPLAPDYKTCGENETILSALCTQTRCTDATKCAIGTGETWDAYDMSTHKCVKVEKPTCGQQMCDAPYCVSGTVLNSLPPIHKIQLPDGTCVNPSESDVAKMCADLGSDHVWVFPNCNTVTVQRVIQASVSSSTTRTITGSGTIPTNAIQSLADTLFSYKLEGLTKTVSGVATVTPSLCTNAASLCFAFTIHLPFPNPPAGSYKLTLYGKPLWSPVVTVESDAAQSVKLSIAPIENGVDPNLNPVPTLSASYSAAQNKEWFLDTLFDLSISERFMWLVIKVPPASTFQSSQLLIEEQTPFVTAAATPDIVPLEGGRLMPYKFVFLSWSPVVSNETVYYDVVRARSNGVGGTEQVLTKSLYPRLLDIVRIGDTWDYTLTASTTTLRSEPVTLSLVVGPFTDSAVCHKVKYTDVPNPMPPWMWATSQGCVWDAQNTAAADYYCAFEFNKTPGDFDPYRVLTLYETSGSNRCGQLQHTYASLSSSFPTTYCTPEPPDYESCFSGVEGGTTNRRSATCDTRLQVGSSASTIDNSAGFVERMQNLVSFYNAHNVYDNLKIEPINGTSNQVDVYDSYNRCGPALNPKWGTTGSTCEPNDVIGCQNAVQQGGCDRNECGPWQLANGGQQGRLTTYIQDRTCYAAASDSCPCPEGTSYKFDPSVPTGMSRGSCVPK